MEAGKVVVASVIFGFLFLAGGVSAGLVYVNVSNTGPTYDGTSEASGWTTIQAGINNATDGDTVYVSAGAYTENVDVNKSVNLVSSGLSLTIVSAFSSTDHVFDVSDTDDVNITNFTVKGATGANKAGIYLYNSSYSKIENVNATGNNDGMYITSSSNITIRNNTANLNSYAGIYLLASNSNTIEGNNASANNEKGMVVFILRLFIPGCSFCGGYASSLKNP